MTFVKFFLFLFFSQSLNLLFNFSLFYRISCSIFDALPDSLFLGGCHDPITETESFCLLIDWQEKFTTKKPPKHIVFYIFQQFPSLAVAQLFLFLFFSQSLYFSAQLNIYQLRIYSFLNAAVLTQFGSSHDNRSCQWPICDISPPEVISLYLQFKYFFQIYLKFFERS